MSEELLVSRIKDLKAQEDQIRKARQRLEGDLWEIRGKKRLEDLEATK